MAARSTRATRAVAASAVKAQPTAAELAVVKASRARVVAALKASGVDPGIPATMQSLASIMDAVTIAVQRANGTVAEAHQKIGALEARCSALETRCGILEGSTPDDGPEPGEVPGEVASAKPRRRFGKAVDEYNAAGKLWRTTRTAPDGSYIAKTFDPATGALLGTIRGQR